MVSLVLSTKILCKLAQNSLSLEIDVDKALITGRKCKQKSAVNSKIELLEPADLYIERIR